MDGAIDGASDGAIFIGVRDGAGIEWCCEGAVDFLKDETEMRDASEEVSCASVKGAKPISKGDTYVRLSVYFSTSSHLLRLILEWHILRLDQWRHLQS